MEVTAKMVKELRERTSAGMMDCKKALIETDGDMEKSIELLREKGLAQAAKKAGRIASEGLVNLKVTEDGKKAAVVEINSETDFVAQNNEFKTFVSNITDIVLDSEVSSIDTLMDIDYPGEGTVSQALNNKIAKIGENLNIRRFEKINDQKTISVGYIHGGGRIGVIIGFETDATYDEISAIGKDVAMQVAAMSPKFIDETEVDKDYIENEKKILTQQALNEGKPAEIVDKMVVGRLKKELKQVCLLEQVFVKDGEITVGKYIANSEKEMNKKIKVTKMIRYEIGEGIDKKEENFAEEVAKQINN